MKQTQVNSPSNSRSARPWASSLRRLRHASKELANNDAGLSTVEYVVLLVLIGAVCIGTWKSFGDKISSELSNAESLFQTNLTTTPGSRR